MADKKPPRPKADHYNTGEIVIRLQRDKQRSGVYFFGALVAGCAILGFFFFQNHRLGSSSSTSSSFSPPAPPAKADSSTQPRTSVFTPLPPPPPPPPAPATVQVQVQAARPGMFWLDAKLLGVKKDFALTLAAPGSYELKGKFGKKVIVEQLAVDPNAPLSVRFDPRKKKAIVRASD